MNLQFLAFHWYQRKGHNRIYIYLYIYPYIYIIISLCVPTGITVSTVNMFSIYCQYMYTIESFYTLILGNCITICWADHRHFPLTGSENFSRLIKLFAKPEHRVIYSKNDFVAGDSLIMVSTSQRMKTHCYFRFYWKPWEAVTFSVLITTKHWNRFSHLSCSLHVVCT